MKKTVLGIVGLALVTGVGFYITRSFSDRGVAVRMVTAEKGSIRATTQVTGTVLNREELTIHSPVHAQIMKLGATEGDQVQRDQVLVHFDTRDYSIQVDKALSALRHAQENEKQTERELEHVKALFALGGESNKAVEDAELRLKAATKDKQIAAKELELRQLQLENLRLKAPMAGIVTSRAARSGTWVKLGEELFNLAPDGVREIEVKLDAGDSLAAAVDKKVVVTSDVYPGREWEEKITWIAPSATKEGMVNSLSVRISLSEQAPSLKLGQQVDVKIRTASRDDVVKIPSRAVITRKGQSLAATVVNDRVHFVPITTGIEDLTHTEVKSGLNAGQRLILPDGKPLREGERVFVSQEQAAS